MENRFGLKDLLVIVLLVAVIVVVLLAMNQYDRQYDRLKRLDTQLGQINDQAARQSMLLKEISQKLDRGVTVAGNAGTQSSGTSTGHASTLKDPFYAQKEAAAKDDYAQGDWLISNMGVKVSKLTPLLSSDVYASIMQNRILESLAYRDPETFEWVPLLAESWDETVDNSKAWQAYIDQRIKVPLTEAEVAKEKECPPADKAEDRKKYIDDRLKEGRRETDIAGEADCPSALTIKFRLRRGVQFSNGDPFTADDVVFTFEFIMNPAVDAPRQRVGYDRLKRIEKTGDYEVVFHFKEPYFESFGLAASISPLSKKFYGRYSPKEFNESVGLLIGTGPYRLPDPAGWNPGRPLELVRNERYWGMAGPFDRLYWHEVEEDAAALAMFRNGEVDTFGANPTQYLSMSKDPEVLARANTFKYYARDGGYSYVAWNQSRAGKPTRFTDKRVRQAMTLLTDRNRMAQDIYRGFGKPAPGPFGVASQQNDPNIQPWPYDPKRAMELLAEAGYKNKNGEGLLLGPDGQPFRFKLIYNNKNPISEQMVLQMKDSMARVGIVLEQEPTDWPIMIKKLDTRDFDAITLGWTGGIETDIYQMFHSSKIADGGDNFMSYRNPELDRLMEKARQTVDEKVRMPIWRKCHQILNEDQAYTFLLYRESMVFIDKRIQNVSQTRSGLNYLSDDVMPIPWYVPASKQKRK